VPNFAIPSPYPTLGVFGLITWKLSIRIFCVFLSSRPPRTNAFTYTARSSTVEIAPPAVHAHDRLASVWSSGLYVPSSAAGNWSAGTA
jgi:hypothetical protein